MLVDEQLEKFNRGRLERLCGPQVSFKAAPSEQVGVVIPSVQHNGETGLSKRWVEGLGYGASSVKKEQTKQHNFKNKVYSSIGGLQHLQNFPSIEQGHHKVE